MQSQIEVRFRDMTLTGDETGTVLSWLYDFLGRKGIEKLASGVDIAVAFSPRAGFITCEVLREKM